MNVRLIPVLLLSVFAIAHAQDAENTLGASEIYDRFHRIVGSAVVYPEFNYLGSGSHFEEAQEAIVAAGYELREAWVADDRDFSALTYRLTSPLKSGTIFWFNDILVSNCHVLIGGALKLEISDELLEGTIGKRDFSRDICSIYLDGNVPSQAETNVQMRLHATLNVGEEVFVIGNPSGLAQSLSSGIVSAIRQQEGIKLIQFTAPISPGSSGSPVFDNAGRLVGIVTSQVTEGQNLNFAVSADHLLELDRTNADLSSLEQRIFQLRTRRLFGVVSGEESGRQWADEVARLLSDAPGSTTSPAVVQLQALSMISEGRSREALMFVDRNVDLGLLDSLTGIELSLEAAAELWLRAVMAHSIDEVPLSFEFAELVAEYGSQFRQYDRFDLDINSATALALSDLGNATQALHVMSDSLAIAPDNPQTHRTIGKVHAGAGSWAPSLRSCQRAVEIWAEDVESWLCIAIAAGNLGDKTLQAEANSRVRELSEG